MEGGGYPPGRPPQGGGNAPGPIRSGGSYSQQGYGGVMMASGSRAPSSTGTMYTGRVSQSRAPSEASAGGSEVREM